MFFFLSTPSRYRPLDAVLGYADARLPWSAIDHGLGKRSPASRRTSARVRGLKRQPVRRPPTTAGTRPVITTGPTGRTETVGWGRSRYSLGSAPVTSPPLPRLPVLRMGTKVGNDLENRAHSLLQDSSRTEPRESLVLSGGSTGIR